MARNKFGHNDALVIGTDAIDARICEICQTKFRVQLAINRRVCGEHAEVRKAANIDRHYVADKRGADRFSKRISVLNLNC